MNIIVVRSDGSFYTRPDTTLARPPWDFYVPDDFSSVSARTCTWVRIIKAGKAVPERFAHRYFDSIGRGVLLYPDGNVPYVDASSFFIPGQKNVSLCLPREVDSISKAIVRITRHVSVRYADVIAFEDDNAPMQFARGDEAVFYKDSEAPFSFNIF